MKLVTLAALVLFACLPHAWAIPNPVVGIVGLPTSEGCVTVTENRAELLRKLDKAMDFDGSSCFSAYYVKWLEQAGARVVPLQHNMTDAQIEDIVSQLNGVLFTGGELDLTLSMPYVRTTKKIYDLATASHEDFFTLWGTCQGFQLLNILTAWNTSVLCNNCFVGVDNIPLALNLTPKAASSRLFNGLPKEVVHILSTENVTQNFHVSGITPDTYRNTPALQQFYDILSTNRDQNGREFLSTMEAKDWPIYATQWHPERPEFEFMPGDDISHTYDAIAAMQLVADFYVQQTRKSPHTFRDSDELDKITISNFPPTNLGHGNLVYVY